MSEKDEIVNNNKKKNVCNFHKCTNLATVSGCSLDILQI